ncbi:MAG: M48 family metallopeptidase [Magnetococcales bacterium]|nr:M48 family metallopeptidase [Magnetococcales bacterium]
MKKRTGVRMGSIRLNGGEALAYAHHRVASRKRITLVVSEQGEVSVRTPPGVGVRRAEAFLRQNADWVLARQEHAEARLAARPVLGEEAEIPYLGESLTLRFFEGRGVVRRLETDLWLPARYREQSDLKPVLERWYRRRAKEHLRARLDHWSVLMAVTFSRLEVRGQKSRWGSCSAKGGISLNWKLMWLPSALVDYVVIHELCHRRHMNHSPAFWAMVGVYDPDYRRHRLALRRFEGPW